MFLEELIELEEQEGKEAVKEFLSVQEEWFEINQNNWEF